MKKNFALVLCIVIVVFGLLLNRLYFISVKSNIYYEKLAKYNITKTEFQPNTRGSIYDSKGKLLATNEIGFSISLSPYLNKTELDTKLDEVLAILPNYDKEKLAKTYKQYKSPYNHDNIKIIDQIEHEYMINKYPRLNLISGEFIRSASRRHYPYKELASHIVGYTAAISKKEKKSKKENKYIDTVGKAGVEKFYENFLRGELNSRRYTVNAKNEEVEEIERFVSQKNTNLTLTLDLRLQKYIHDSYKKKEFSGSLIVMDSTNGDILAALSYPEYDLNLFTKGISHKEWDKIRHDITNPFTNKISTAKYPPGSLLKMGVGLSFLNNGISKNKTVYDTGEFIFANRKFRCWLPTGHKKVNFKRSIVESCDDYYYKTSYDVGINNISETLRDLGLGQKTLIDLPDEHIGTVPNKAWKRKRFDQPWYVGETFISAIGQGYNLVTPIQLAKYFAIFAHGHEVVPHFLKKMGNYEIKYHAYDGLDPKYKKYFPLIRSAMYGACHDKRGTGTKYVQNSRYSLACKTGTAQVSSISQTQKKRLKESELAYLNRSHSWFGAFFPYKKPKYVIVAIVEHGGYGGSTLGTLVANTANYMHRLGYLK